MDISQFKQENPDYKDVPDVQLADALHAKYYADVPRDQFMQQVGVAGPGGNFNTAMPRADYAKQFMANNPGANQDHLDMALAQFDRAAEARTQAAGNGVQDRFKQMASPEATFNAQLDERLQGDRNGVVPALPGKLQPDAPVAAAPSWSDTIGANVTGGALGTLAGGLASASHLVGADDYGNEIDSARAQMQAVMKQHGGDTMTGKVASLVGGVAPALAMPEGAVSQYVANAGLFALPAFDDTLKAKLAEGYSRPLALAHAAEAFGVNLFMPTVATRGSGAIIKGLGQAEAAGVRGAAVGLGQAAGEGVGFSAANSVLDKGTDVIAGQKNDRAWVDPEDMAVQAAGFGLLRAGHMVPGAVNAVAGRLADARSFAEASAHLADIGRAGSVDEAIAAATQAVDAVKVAPEDGVADILRTIRPLDVVPPVAEVAPPIAAPDARVEPTLGDAGLMPPDYSVANRKPGPADGIDLTAGMRDPDAPNVWRAREPSATPQRDAIDRVIDPMNDWHAFPPDTGTLGVPRADMPQIRAEHRGAMTNFLNARGIEHEQVEVPAESLKPTQAEFSLDKVLKAQQFDGGNRSILVSSDGYVLDGHHQWLAAVDAGEPVKAIRFDAPIAELLQTVKEFPSATLADGAPAAPGPVDVPAAPANHLDAAAQKFAKQDAAVLQAAQNIAARKSTGGSRARERIHAENPFLGFLATHGVNILERADAGAERGRAGNPLVPGFGPVFRKSGLRFDELALAARDAGFLTQADIDKPTDTGGTRKLATMIERATMGKESIRPIAEADYGKSGAHDKLLQEAHDLGIDEKGLTPDEVYDQVVAAHRALEQHREQTGAATVDEQAAIEHHADQFSHDEAALLRDEDIPLSGLKADENLTDEQIDEIFGIKPGAAAADGRQAQDGAAGAAREGDQGTADAGDALTSYTAGEVTARQDAAAKRERATAAERAKLDASARKERDQKDVAARMDTSAEHFELGQDAEKSLSGQKGILDAPPAAENKRDENIQKETGKVQSEPDTGADIPLDFFKKTKVPHEVWIADEGQHETVELPAHKALASVREDIDNLQKLRDCLKG